MRSLKNRFAIPVLIAALGFIAAGRVTAQTFTTLHSFTTADGAYPKASLVLSGNTLYGTAELGGSSGSGTMFAINTDGTSFANLHTFTAVTQNTNSDGVNPFAGLLLLGSTLYGTAANGGISGSGTVFAINTNGTSFTNLHAFTSLPVARTNSDGANPLAGLILSSNTLYGTAGNGGIGGHGSVFAVNTDGSGFTNLYSFMSLAYPEGGLVLSSNILFGMTGLGGSSTNGMVFAVNVDGTAFTTLHNFGAWSGVPTNMDGARPSGGLILSGSTLYGTTVYGGSGGRGTVFKVDTDGTNFLVLHNFTGPASNPTNTDGAQPYSDLVLCGSTLYGTASSGGTSGKGTLFAVNTNGTGFTNLHSFTGGSDGANPYAGLILSGNTLFGTAQGGGTSGVGTVFSLSLPVPQLSITPFGPNVILTWPTDFAGFDYSGYTLQSTTNLVSPFWTTNSPAPVVANGQNTVTNPISGTQQFFRLSQ